MSGPGFSVGAAAKNSPSHRGDDFPSVSDEHARDFPARQCARPIHLKEDPMKSATFAALALAFAALFAGCDSGPEKLKLGVAGPMTGTDAAFGAQLKNGVEQAVTD